MFKKLKLFFHYLKLSIFNNDPEARYRLSRAISRVILLPDAVKAKVKDKLFTSGYFGSGKMPEKPAQIQPQKKIKDFLQKQKLEFSETSRGGSEYSKTFRKHDNRVLIIQPHIPVPVHMSGSSRLYVMLQLIIEEGHPVTFLSFFSKEQNHKVFHDDSEFESNEKNLADMGIDIIYGAENGLRHLENLGYRYSQVVLSYPDVAFKLLPAVRAHAVNAELIFDTVELYGLRFRKEAELKGDSEILKRADYYDNIEKICIDCSDKVIAITENEKHNILQISSDAKVEVIRNAHSTNQLVTPFSDRSGLLFIGHYQYSSNQDAVTHFIDKVLPLIHDKLPGVKITLLGSGITDEIAALAGEYVDAVGYVEDLEPYFSSHKVFVSPLKYGEGMMGDIDKSLSLGLPLVTTTIGAKAMGIESGKQGLIADDDIDFANAVVDLYSNEELWKNLAISGIDHVEDLYSFNAMRNAIKKVFPSREIKHGEGI